MISSAWLALALALTSSTTTALARGASDSPAALTLAGPAGSRSYTLAQLQSRLKTVAVELEDPLYKTTKTFDSFALRDLIDLIGLTPAQSQTIDDIAFTAKDGYTPGIAIAKARTHDAFVAFREHGLKGFRRVIDGKQSIDPAPYYVVWTGKGLGEEYPRPYQLVRIELISYAAKFPKIYPREAKAGSTVLRGFTTFRAMCVRCHSINLEGGAIGPELNVPQNVTEYWYGGTLRKIIRKVSSFRSASKMPDFDKDLSEDDVAAVVEYLEYMREHKI